MTSASWDQDGHEDLSAGLRAYPRLDFVRRITAVFDDEASRHPDGTFAKLERDAGISKYFAANPLDRR